MKDFNDNGQHEVQRLTFGLCNTVYAEEISEKFGSSPDWLTKLYDPYWEDIKKLIDWIINNTPYQLISISSDGKCSYYYFIK